MTPQELFGIGLTYEGLGKLDEAQRAYARIVHLFPEEVSAYHRLAVLALQHNDPAHALAWIDKALAFEQRAVGLWNNRALALIELSRFDEAHEAFERAVAISPNNWAAWYNQGRMLLKQKQFAEAERALRKAAEIDPNSANTLNNLGLALHFLYRYEEAIKVFDSALTIEPANTEIITNKGVALYYSHKLPCAETWIRKAIEINPKDPNAHYNLSAVLMSGGKIEEGFREYEWRWQSRDWTPIRKYFGRPLWDGHKLESETILVWPEQGYGDTIQFIRFLYDLAKQDCEIIAEVPDSLYRLLVASFSLPNVRWLRHEAKPPTFDIHVPLLSLPHHLQYDPETALPFKPYLRPRGRELEDWRGKLKTMTAPENRKKKRVGIVWAGSPGHPNDRNRSMTWETIRPLVDAHSERVQFFSLQHGQAIGHQGVIDLSSHLTDFAVTASIIAHLDLVIAVDTSIVHLTGALGKRAWVMLSHTPDWRWVIGEEKTSWYPTLALFWQKQPGDWSGVIDEVSDILTHLK